MHENREIFMKELVNSQEFQGVIKEIIVKEFIADLLEKIDSLSEELNTRFSKFDSVCLIETLLESLLMKARKSSSKEEIIETIHAELLGFKE